MRACACVCNRSTTKRYLDNVVPDMVVPSLDHASAKTGYLINQEFNVCVASSTETEKKMVDKCPADGLRKKKSDYLVYAPTNKDETGEIKTSGGGMCLDCMGCTETTEIKFFGCHHAGGAQSWQVINAATSANEKHHGGVKNMVTIKQGSSGLCLELLNVFDNKDHVTGLLDKPVWSLGLRPCIADSRSIKASMQQWSFLSGLLATNPPAARRMRWQK